jgi:hypothetical protein
MNLTRFEPWSIVDMLHRDPGPRPARCSEHADRRQRGRHYGLGTGGRHH